MNTILSTFTTGRIRVLIAAAAMSAVGLLGGCNNANSALVQANRALTEQNQKLTQENESLNNLVQKLQAAVSARDKALDEANRMIASLRSGQSGLEGKLADLANNMPQFGSLDATTDQALRDLASQHSDILEYDPARGMLRFKSDVTFASGSDMVRDSAKSTLSQLSSILNGAAAAYSIRIVGHTDTQRLHGDTLRRHTTNLRLSADRAISVRNVLVSDGVSAPRFEIAGRGEFDPMVPNTPSGNTPQNRRVEVYLFKAVSREPMGATETPMEKGTAAPMPTHKTKNEEILK